MFHWLNPLSQNFCLRILLLLGPKLTEVQVPPSLPLHGTCHVERMLMRHDWGRMHRCIIQAQIGNSLIHTTQAHTHTHTDTHAHRARLDERLPFGWTWQWFWNVDNCQIKITQAISQARIWMQVSEQKERATGSGPSDFTIYHRVSCALRKRSHTRMGGSASTSSSHCFSRLPWFKGRE